MTFVGGKIPSGCSPPPETKLRRCSSGGRSWCPTPKGPRELPNAPTLIEPYGGTLLGNRPSFSWESVEPATSYTVRVVGRGLNWQKTVNSGTKLAYPENQPAMKAGDVYEVAIVANRDSEPISVVNSAFYLLSSELASQVKDLVGLVKQFHLPKNEAAYLDLDTIYLSYDLLNASIETLEARIEAGSESPAVYRVLGNRYLQARLPEKAKQQYQAAIKWAQKTGKTGELKKAQARLRELEASSQSN